MTILFYLFMAIVYKATLVGWSHDADDYRRDR